MVQGTVVPARCLCACTHSQRKLSTRTPSRRTRSHARTHTRTCCSTKSPKWAAAGAEKSTTTLAFRTLPGVLERGCRVETYKTTPSINHRSATQPIAPHTYMSSLSLQCDHSLAPDIRHSERDIALSAIKAKVNHATVSPHANTQPRCCPQVHPFIHKRHTQSP